MPTDANIMDTNARNATLLNNALRPKLISDTHKPSFSIEDVEIIKAQIHYQEWLLSKDVDVYLKELEQEMERVDREYSYVMENKEKHVAEGRLKSLTTRLQYVEEELERQKVSKAVAKGQNNESGNGSVSGKTGGRRLTDEQKQERDNKQLLAQLEQTAKTKGIDVKALFGL